MSGEIPPELGSLSNLTVLVLSVNELSGEIPAELGSLSNLTDLYLSSNELSGEIPAELGSLSNLRTGPQKQRLERGDTGGAWQPLQPDKAGPQQQRLERVRAGQPGRPVEQLVYPWRPALLLKPRALSRGRTAYRPYRLGGAPGACWLWRMAPPAPRIKPCPRLRSGSGRGL